MAASNRLRPLLVAGAVGALLLLASRGLASGYSYWADELFSVATSQDGWEEMFTRWILPDTHPPLYPLLLKLWMGLVGPSETATRSLSFLTAALTLVSAALLSRDRSLVRQLAVVALIGSSSAFAFYGQETRNYALVLLLSTLLTGSTLELRNPAGVNPPPTRRSRILIGSYYISAAFLSLTHYFAWIFVAVLAGLNTVEARVDRCRSRGVLLLLGIAVWPLLHWLISRGSGQRGKIAWIDVTPIRGTLETFLRGTLDLFAFPAVNLVIGLMAATVLVILAKPGQMQLRTSSAGSPGSAILSAAHHEIRFLLLLLGLFIGSIAAIDLVLPISTSRNYIVCLPAVAFLIGNAVEIGAARGERSRGLTLGLLALLVVLQLGQAQQRLENKIFPRMNYKALASFLDEEEICREGCRFLGWPKAPATDFYFGGMLDPADAMPRNSPGSLPQAPLIVASPIVIPPNEVLHSNPDFQCWEPIQHRKHSVMIFLDPGHGNTAASHGLKPCRP
jgi:uncharacterized membrane protein